MINIEYDKERDAYIVPKWLMRNILDYDNEILEAPYNSLTDYGKGIVDTLKEQHQKFSINMKP